MAKDIIFSQNIKETPVARTHYRLNNTIERMKNDIRNCSTVESAASLLLETYGREYGLFIKAAVREAFATSEERLKNLI